MASGKSEKELMEEIAERIAKNQMEFDSKSEDEKRELAKKIQAVTESQLDEIKKSFNKLMGNMTEQVPLDARVVVLEGIYDRVSSQKLKTLDSAFSSTEAIKYAEVVVSNVKKSKEEVDNDENVIPTGIDELPPDKSAKDEMEDTIGDNTAHDISDEQENVTNLFNKLDKDAVNNIITEAANGDEKSKAIVVAMMSVASLTKTNKKLSDLTDFQKEDVLTGIEWLAEAAEGLGSKESLDLLDEVCQKLGVDVVENDAQGNRTVNRGTIKKLFEKNGMKYRRCTTEDLYKLGSYYQPGKDYDDIVEEARITIAQKEMRNCYNTLMNQLRDGKITEEEFKREFEKVLDVDLDAALRITAELSADLELDFIRPEEKRVIEAALVSTYGKYLKAQNGEIKYEIDAYVLETLKSSFQNVCNHVVNEPNAELMNIMLKIDPTMTQQFFDKAKYKNSQKENTENEVSAPENEKRVLTEEEKIDNLTRVLTERSKVKGISDTLQSVQGSIDRNQGDDQTRRRYMNASLMMLGQVDISYEESERDTRKRFFEKLLHEKIYDENALKQMLEIDSTTVKEVLEELLEMQNARQDDRLETIMDLSAKIKEVAMGKVISADKVDVKDVLQNVISGTNNSGKKDIPDKDDGEHDL